MKHTVPVEKAYLRIISETFRRTVCVMAGFKIASETAVSSCKTKIAWIKRQTKQSRYGALRLDPGHEQVDTKRLPEGQTIGRGLRDDLANKMELRLLRHLLALWQSICGTHVKRHGLPMALHLGCPIQEACVQV